MYRNQHFENDKCMSINILEYYSIKNMDNYLSVCLKLCIFDTLNF